MDKTQARFILDSFRPDGADALDPDFAEALALAMTDRELGDWLAHERALDTAFADALATVDLPETLRSGILACLAAERVAFPRAENVSDASWIGALASLQTPPALRDQVLAAMDRTIAKAVPAPKNVRKFPRFWPVWVPLAAAAGIALALGLPRAVAPSVVVRTHVTVPISAVEAGFVQAIESPKFQLEEKTPDHMALVAHLRDRGLPCPRCLPPGLRSVAGFGCRELMVDGVRGSLICFDLGTDGLVHLVIFQREDVRGDFPKLTDPRFVSNGGWATAMWADKARVYLALSRADSEKLAALF
jgi:hypothetical protein